MDFMNLNQAAHGDREFGFICSRLRLNRKVVVGHWEDEDVHARLDVWMRAACAWADSQRLQARPLRRQHARGGGHRGRQGRRPAAVRLRGERLRRRRPRGEDREGDRRRGRPPHEGVRRALRAQGLEGADGAPCASRPGSRSACARSSRKAASPRFTDTFEDLHGLEQLPGLAVQRLMAEGYGFGAEGDWKTAALVRAMKVMATGLTGGTSFMEDYTYHLDPKGAKVLGAHMLEVCPTIARGKPTLEVHPLGIGGKADPARLVFDTRARAGRERRGDRPRQPLPAGRERRRRGRPRRSRCPKLPVARALWVPRPDLKVAAAAWIHAGGSHHTAFSLAIGPEHLRDFADMAGVEFVLIDEHTRLVRDPEGAALERGVLPDGEGNPGLAWIPPTPSASTTGPTPCAPWWWTAPTVEPWARTSSTIPRARRGSCSTRGTRTSRARTRPTTWRGSARR